MFTIAFKSGKDGDLVYGARPLYNEEHLIDPYKRIHIQAPIGQTFADFVSLKGDIEHSNHPYIQIAGEYADGITENSSFLVHIREYLDLMIDNPEFASEACFMYFLSRNNIRIPAYYHVLEVKAGHENDDVMDYAPKDSKMSRFEREMRGYLASGDKIYDVPFTEYSCETIEDVCIASLHYLLAHKMNILKCKNCGKYFISYYRSDTQYCDRISPFNPSRTCKEDGARRTYNRKRIDDELSRSIYNKKQARKMRIRRCEDSDDREELIAENIHFEELLEKKKADYHKGLLSTEAFMEWLNNNKNYRPYWREHMK